MELDWSFLEEELRKQGFTDIEIIQTIQFLDKELKYNIKLSFKPSVNNKK